MIREKTVAESDLMRRFRDILEEIHRDGVVYIVKTNERSNLAPGGLVDEMGEISYVLLSDVFPGCPGPWRDPEYGWPVLVDVESIKSAADFSPGYKRHPTIARGSLFLARSIMIREYEQIKREFFSDHPDFRPGFSEIASRMNSPNPLGVAEYHDYLGRLLGDRMPSWNASAPIIGIIDAIFLLAVQHRTEEMRFEVRDDGYLDIRMRRENTWTDFPPLACPASAISRLIVIGHLEKGADARSNPQAAFATILGLPMFFETEPVRPRLEHVRVRIDITREDVAERSG
jgi:hypothetical protein